MSRGKRVEERLVAKARDRRYSGRPSWNAVFAISASLASTRHDRTWRPWRRVVCRYNDPEEFELDGEIGWEPRLHLRAYRIVLRDGFIWP